MSGAVPRILALVAAVAMVVGALAVRDRMDNDEKERSQTLRLVCATELEEACRALADDHDSDVEVSIEEAGATADRLLNGDRDGLDGWLTPGPWPQMVQEVRRSRGEPVLVSEVSARVARSRVAVAVWRARGGPLAFHCPGRHVHMHCLGLAAGRPWTEFDGQETWGEVKTAIGDPVMNATALAALGAGTAAFFGRADVSSDELRDNDGFGVWLNALADANRRVELEQVLAGGPGLADAVAALDVTAAPLIKGAPVERQVGLFYGDPVMTADVVLGTTDTPAGERLQALIRSGATQKALSAAGWETTGGRAESGLPSPGLLFALRTMWREAAR